jgi:hypothetical protein
MGTLDFTIKLCDACNGSRLSVIVCILAIKNLYRALFKNQRAYFFNVVPPHVVEVQFYFLFFYLAGLIVLSTPMQLSPILCF